MRIWRLTFIVLAILAMAIAANPASGGAVAVGFSALIETLDYSDTFTQDGVYRVDGQPFDGGGLTPEGLKVETTYDDNPESTWHYSLGYSYTHSTAPGCTNIPAPIPDSGAGSDTGIAVQSVDNYPDMPYPDYGFAYGVRDKFVVQYDAIQTNDRIDIGIGSQQADGQLAILLDGNVTLFFRTEDKTNQIAVYDGTPNTQYGTGLPSGIETYGEWHNYAVYFDLVDDDVDPDGTGRRFAFFVDQQFRGLIDIDTFHDGDLADIVLSNAYVHVGYANGNTGDAHYFDNVQVGEPKENIIPSIPGDTNNDGCVDAADAEVLATNWGNSVTPGDVTVGDFDGDGLVGPADASILASNWHYGCGESNPVPEPSVLVGLLSMLLVVAIRRDTRR